MQTQYLGQNIAALTTLEKPTESKKEFIKTFFSAIGAKIEDEIRHLDAYTARLNEIDLEDLSDTLEFVADTWNKTHIPPIGHIIEQHKIRMSAKSRRNRPEQLETDNAPDFWKIFAECRNNGLSDVGEIASEIAKAIGAEPIPSKLCPNRVCNGKRYISAYRKNDPFKSEAIFQCTCTFDPKLPIWEGLSEWVPVSGLNESRMVYASK